METPLTIANYFIKKSLETGIPVTPMKLVKLVYISHGWYLALSEGEELIDEAVEAWKYGPVISSVYHKFKLYGRDPINKLEPNALLNGIYHAIIPNNAGTLEFLNKMWDMYGKFDGVQLSALTHQKGTPWDITYKSKGDGALIPNNLIREHYEGKLVKTA